MVFTPEQHRATFSCAWLAAQALPRAAPAWPSLAARPSPRAHPDWTRWRVCPESRAPRGERSGPAAAVTGPAAAESDLAARADRRTEDGKRLWRAAQFADRAELPGAAWEQYLADDAVRAECLDAVATLGFARLRDVPAEPGTVLRVAQTFGFVRETNYGPLFDVRVVVDPANLAFTSRAIAPHTDNPYRDPVPTLQLLHCLRDADLGGDTGLVDGFAAAAALRAADPQSFTVLTRTSWPFAYVDQATELRASQPLITLTPAGRVTAVRLNNRSVAPLRLPAAEAEAAYAAYRAWATLLAQPEYQLTLRLVPGDCLIFDNTRILHARTAFAAPGDFPEAAGERHLQGCYTDIDGLLSTLAVLRRADSSR